jgi:hypothetical protein
MTEEEQIAYAIRMSMADSQADAAQGESMEVDDKDADYRVHPQNDRFQNVRFQNVQFLNLIYLQKV